jgi:hypothetical protein
MTPLHRKQVIVPIQHEPNLISNEFGVDRRWFQIEFGFFVFMQYLFLSPLFLIDSHFKTIYGKNGLTQFTSGGTQLREQCYGIGAQNRNSWGVA